MKQKTLSLNQGFVGIIIVIIVVLLIAGGLFFYLNYQTKKTAGSNELPKSEQVQEVKDFEECVARGYQVLESTPRQCKTPEGATFTEETKQEEPALPSENNQEEPPKISCSDDCSTGQKKCIGNGYQVCGSYDNDSCLEWGSIIACSANTICQNGNCIQQKCSDGTLYGQCSTNKPKYCNNGSLDENASLCGCPNGYRVSESYCILELTKLDPKSGLIVIRSGVDGENFTKEIALSKGWSIISVGTSDYKQIKSKIVNFYAQKKFDYLLLIGTNEELPYAVYNSQKDLWETDSLLYGDINSDRFIELGVGRLPFSSETELKKYFTGLNPRGNFITLENYSHYNILHYVGDASVYNYAYDKCLASSSNSIRTYRYSTPLDLVKHYYESAALVLTDAGSPDAVFSAGMLPNPDNQVPVLHINSFCKNFNGDTSWLVGEPKVCEREYLTNRPIVIHYSCNNAQNLGRQLIENGAGAFLGFYEAGGYLPQLTSQLLTGKSIGEITKNVYNSEITLGTVVKNNDGRTVNLAEDNLGMNNFNITNTWEGDLNIELILYGDPTLTIPENIQKPDYNVSIEQQKDEIVIKIKPPRLVPLEVASAGPTDILCYTGESVTRYAQINRNNEFSHVLNLIFPVTGIRKLISQEATIGDEKIILNQDNEKYSINLLNGVTEQYMVVLVNSAIWPQRESHYLDYTKEFEIFLKYE
jgi:hypothetical protein